MRWKEKAYRKEGESKGGKEVWGKRDERRKCEKKKVGKREIMKGKVVNGKQKKVGKEKESKRKMKGWNSVRVYIEGGKEVMGKVVIRRSYECGKGAKAELGERKKCESRERRREIYCKYRKWREGRRREVLKGKKKINIILFLPNF